MNSNFKNKWTRVHFNYKNAYEYANYKIKKDFTREQIIQIQKDEIKLIESLNELEYCVVIDHINKMYLIGGEVGGNKTNAEYAKTSEYGLKICIQWIQKNASKR